jgi:hydroxymethylbilane synthase
VADALEDRRFEVELVEVETEGDQIRDELIHRLGRTGAFVRALDERVLDGEVDAAVHSLKDVPTEMPDDLVVAAVPERGPPGDVLVTPDGASLDELPEGAVVGTSSLRRQAQLLAARPDLRVEPLRGNVDTRVEKLLAPSLQAEHERRLEGEEGEGGGEDGEDEQFEQTVEEWFEGLSEVERRALGREVETEFDAIVLAEAGLARTGLDRHVGTRRLPTGEFAPAPGQGALAVTSRDDDVGEAIHSALDHPRSRVETTTERVVLAELGGGCIAPIGVYGLVQGEYVHVEAGVYSRDGSESVTASRDLPVEEYVAAARDLAADMADEGARDLVAEAKRE